MAGATLSFGNAARSASQKCTRTYSRDGGNGRLPRRDPAVTRKPDDAGLLLLHRAIANAGDALILERARRLIANVHPRTRLDIGEAWHPLDEQIPAERLRRYRAIVICGGPGYARGIARLYPLGPLDELPPLVLLALGSHVIPGTNRQLAAFRFDALDGKFLDATLARSAYLGARDPLTVELLNRNGYQRVLMTGDPAWYDLEAIDRPIRTPIAFKAVAFTPPANPAFHGQACRLFRALADAVPQAQGRVVFHRGVQRSYAALAERHGWQCVDISGRQEGFRIYDEMDLHVGYRVHAHLYSTSVGTPSYVIAEDSRGIGVLRSFPGLGLAAFPAERPLPWLEIGIGALARPRRRPIRRSVRPFEHLLGLPDISGPLMATIERDLAGGFPAHAQARDTIRATLPVMRQMIESIP